MQLKILMVCLGNICRSPVAEGILQQYANDFGLPWVVDSAGTNGLHNGEAPHQLSQKIAKQHGIDISKQVSRRFKREDVTRYDKIFVMADDVMHEVKQICGNDFDAEKITYFLKEASVKNDSKVPDPWYGGEAGFVTVHKIIDDACKAIINKYANITV
jgi:protein-tyrosine phosphatase